MTPHRSSFSFHSGSTSGPTTAFTLVVALVRAWTRAYTWHMSPELRERRRAEIESDLWEFQQDQLQVEAPRQDADGHRRPSPALQILARLLRGLPHDLTWRVEQAAFTHALTRSRTRLGLAGTAAVSATVALVLGALWLAALLQPSTLPKPQPTAWPIGQSQLPPQCLTGDAGGTASGRATTQTARR
jgi:hypothetical protein